MTTTVDTVSLQARLTQANQPTPAQMLLADLWAALNGTLADLAAAQQQVAAGANAAAQLAALQAQVDDLTRQLAAAQAVATADGNQIVALMAKDGAALADLTRQNADLTTAAQAAAAALATAQQQAAAAQSAAQTATQALATTQDKLAVAQKQLTQDVIDKGALQATIDALRLQLAGQAPAPLPVNHNPVWAPVPLINFTTGHASEISVAGFVSDPDVADVLTLALISAGLPLGVTFDAPNKKFVYDGLGPEGRTTGNILNANDGKP